MTCVAFADAQERCRAEQNEGVQDKVGQIKVSQGKAEPKMFEQYRVEQIKAGEGCARQTWTEQGCAGQGSYFG